jgi:hypothetical protein
MQKTFQPYQNIMKHLKQRNLVNFKDFVIEKTVTKKLKSTIKLQLRFDEKKFPLQDFNK